MSRWKVLKPFPCWPWDDGSVLQLVLVLLQNHEKLKAAGPWRQSRVLVQCTMSTMRSWRQSSSAVEAAASAVYNVKVSCTQCWLNLATVGQSGVKATLHRCVTNFVAASSSSISSISSSSSSSMSPSASTPTWLSLQFSHDCSDCRRVSRFGVGQNLYILKQVNSHQHPEDQQLLVNAIASKIEGEFGFFNKYHIYSGKGGWEGKEPFF